MPYLHTLNTTLKGGRNHENTNHLGRVVRYTARQLCLLRDEQTSSRFPLRSAVPRCGQYSPGESVALLSAKSVYTREVWNDWLVLAVLTLLTGSFTVRVPGLLARISVSDAFVFASVLVFGPPVATVIVAARSRLARRHASWMRPEHRSLLRSLFNVTSVALSIWIASHTFYWLTQATPGVYVFVVATGWSVVRARGVAGNFLINSWLIAFALSFEKDASVVELWWENFPVAEPQLFWRRIGRRSSRISYALDRYHHYWDHSSAPCNHVSDIQDVIGQTGRRSAPHYTGE